MVIFWDNNNVEMNKPGDASLQQITCSNYYTINCTKGGMFIKLRMGGLVVSHNVQVELVIRIINLKVGY